VTWCIEFRPRSRIDVASDPALPLSSCTCNTSRIASVTAGFFNYKMGKKKKRIQSLVVVAVK